MNPPFPDMTNSLRYLRAGLLGSLILCLGGCANSDMSDLEKYVSETKARKNPHVDPIPEFKIFPSHFYEVYDKPDPFKPPKESQDESNELSALAAKRDCPQPDRNRVLEELEKVPLDAISMVGILEDGGNIWGLVVAGGLVYRVKYGDYLGQNFGRIISITESTIEVEYLQSDGEGCWEPKRTSILLSEKS